MNSPPGTSSLSNPSRLVEVPDDGAGVRGIRGLQSLQGVLLGFLDVGTYLVVISCHFVDSLF